MFSAVNTWKGFAKVPVMNHQSIRPPTIHPSTHTSICHSVHLSLWFRPRLYGRDRYILQIGGWGKREMYKWGLACFTLPCSSLSEPLLHPWKGQESLRQGIETDSWPPSLLVTVPLHPYCSRKAAVNPVGLGLLPKWSPQGYFRNSHSNVQSVTHLHQCAPQKWVQCGAVEWTSKDSMVSSFCPPWWVP